MNLDAASILGIIGLIITLLGCTWRISGQMSKQTAATKGLEESVNHLSSTFDSHVTESNNRDKQNQREHNSFSVSLAGMLEAIKSLGSRCDRTEARDDAMNKRLDDHHTRLAVVEAGISTRTR